MKSVIKFGLLAIAMLAVLIMSLESFLGDKTLDQSEIYGLYSAQYKDVKSELNLRDNLTFDQMVKLPNGTKNEYKGRWELLKFDDGFTISLKDVYDLKSMTVSSYSTLIRKFYDSRISFPAVIDPNVSYVKR